MSEASIIEGIRLEDEDLHRLLERIADRIDPTDSRICLRPSRCATGFPAISLSLFKPSSAIARRHP